MVVVVVVVVADVVADIVADVVADGYLFVFHIAETILRTRRIGLCITSPQHISTPQI